MAAIIAVLKINPKKKLPLPSILPDKKCVELLKKEHLKRQLFLPGKEICGGHLIRRRWSKDENLKLASCGVLTSKYFRFAYFTKGSDHQFQRITNTKRRRIIGLGGSDACHV